MKFNEKWLREWVNPEISTQTLSEQLTMAGLEVDAVEPVAAEFSSVVIGEVLSVEPHPDADRLRICSVNVGQPEPLSIVCGAANVAPDQYVPTALIGAKLPNDLKIRKSKLRGVESQGMLCSAVELGLAESADGLLILPHDGEPGQDIRDYLQLDDVAIELGITPNRGDCLSIAGIARETSVLNQITITEPEAESFCIELAESVAIELQAPNACSRYIGRVIKGVNPQLETPLWMRERLRRCGLRSISAIVDVTNYVMLELGQPMHAFDLGKIEGSIQVRYAKPKEELQLLDEQWVTLDSETLVIADDEKSLALAGVMGGNRSAVDNETQDLFLECAFFHPDAIAGKARSYGLHTDSSHRFERGVDPKLPVKAIKRATGLLLEIVGGKAGPLSEAVAAEHLPERQPITLRADRIRRVLGIDIATTEVTDILCRLDMRVMAQGKEWIVTPPSARFDLSIEADLIEEVGRIYGYDKLPTYAPIATLNSSLPVESDTSPKTLRQLLVGRGYQEAITYSFVDPALQQSINPDHEAITLANPISADMGVMRTSLWPGLLGAAAYNQKRQHSRIRLFEFGVKFSRQDDEIKEENMISGVVCGTSNSKQWGEERGPVDFFDLKSDVEALLKTTRQSDAFRFAAATHPALHPGQTAAIYDPEGRKMGWIGRLHPTLQQTVGLNDSVLLFELAYAAIAERSIPHFKPSSKFPATRRDLSIVIAEEVAADKLQNSIREIAGTNLTKLELFDVYRGKGIEFGRKSLALGLTFQNSSRTLTDQEIDNSIAEVLNQLKQSFNATLRE